MSATHSPHPCRSCGCGAIEPVLSLGRTPLANALVAGEVDATAADQHPLTLALCRECTLLQILEDIPPKTLFSDYPYFSSVSETLRTHARDLARRIAGEFDLGPGSLVLEIASNDGYLLRNFVEMGVPVLGVEPAANVGAAARAAGVETRCAFFERTLADQLCDEGVAPDVIFANNVLAHAADLNDFMSGVARLLRGRATFEVEFPYVRDLIEGCEFDTIYHEHRCYFSLTAIRRLAQRHGLETVDVGHEPIHGGSLHVRVARPGAWPVRPAVDEMIAAEREWSGTDAEPYRVFSRRAQALRDEIRGTLESLRSSGKRVAAYGAAAKGVTLLSYCGLGREHLDYVVDRSPHKQGKRLPGSGLPVLAPEQLLADRPDYVLLLTWNFKDEILRQQSEYRRLGGRFVVPVPQVEIL